MAIKQKLVTNEEIYNKLNEISALLSTTNEEPMRVEEAAKFLCLSPSSLYHYTRRNILPHVKIEGSLLFLKSDLIKWLREIRREAC
jgi:predicted DNA-binding transcriptional regulator AlpA